MNFAAFSSPSGSSPVTPPAHGSPSYARDLWRLALVLIVFFFAFLGGRPLSNPDEGRYAEIPREMALTGDYITPRLNGVKYFEKPPLVYWLSALTFKVTGVNEWSARFWCAAFAVFGAMVTYVAGRALYDRKTGLFSALVLSLSLLYYGLSRVILLDLIVAVWIATTLFSFLAAVREPPSRKRRLLFLGFYGGMALATLTKGLIGIVLPCAVAGLWVLALNQWRALRPVYPFSGSLLLLGIAAPWHVLAARANPDFLWFYFVHEHFLRFATQTHGRYEPWWFFVPVLLAGLFPWVVFLPQALRQGLRGGWGERLRNNAAWFLVIWIGFILLFFSKSQSKLVPYILPVFPAVAVLIGRYIATAWAEPHALQLRKGLYTYVALCGVFAIGLSVVKVSRDAAIAASLYPWQWSLVALFAVSGLVVAVINARRGGRTALVALSFSTAALFVLLNFVGERADRRSTRPLALILKPQLQPGDEVYAVGEYFQDLPVYLDRLVSVVDYEGELAFGIHAEPEKSMTRFLSREAFRARWRQPERRFAVVRKRDLAELLAAGDFPHVVMGEFREQVLLGNRPTAGPKPAASTGSAAKHD